MARRDWLPVPLIFFGTLIARIPWRSLYAYHWDSAQFALAIERYDLAISQPHLPGYMLYVQLGRLVNLAAGDPHASLVWLSVVAGAALPALGYRLGAAWFGPRGGWGAAVLLATGPLFWFQSEVALTTIVDAALVTATVLAGWRAMNRDGGWRSVVLLAALLAAVAGVRPQTGATLLPLWLYFLLRLAPPRLPKLAAAVALAALLSLVWLVPLLRAAGGVADYLGLLALKNEYVRAKTVWAGGGLPALGRNLVFVGVSCWGGLLLAGVALLAEGALRGVRGRQRSPRFGCDRRVGIVLGLWVVPMVLFGVAVYYTEMPGYVLSYLPALALAAAWALDCAGTRLEQAVAAIRGDRPGRRPGWGVWVFVAGAGLLNSAVFLFEPAGPTGLLGGLPVTRAHLASVDRRMAACVAAVRRLGPPDQVVLAHHGESFLLGLRQFQYHLPAYRQVLLTPDPSLPGEAAHQYWVAQGTATEFVPDLRVLRMARAVLVVPGGGAPAMFAGVCDLAEARPVPGTEERLWLLEHGCGPPPTKGGREQR